MLRTINSYLGGDNNYIVLKMSQFKIYVEQFNIPLL